MQTKHLKVLFEKINSLSKTEHEEIFKIIKDKISFSKNKNGVFFNLSNLDENIIEEINSFVSYCINNKKDLDDYDKKINECKINNNFNNIMGESDVSCVKAPLIEVEDWNAIATETKSVSKITSFIEKILSDHEKIGKKKINVKFNNAKKRYAKKAAQNLIADDDTELQHDEYVIT